MTTPKRSNEWTGEKVRDTLSFIEKLTGKEIVELEDAIDIALTEKDAEMEKALEAKAIEVREEEANEYNKIIEKEAEKARASLHASLVAAVEGKIKGYVGNDEEVPEIIAYNQGIKDTLTIINSIFKE